MHLVFVMDGPETVAPATDTSFALMVAARDRGHTIWHCGVGDLEYADGTVWAMTSATVLTADGLSLGAPARLDLADVDAVMIRPDPPFDSAYLHLTLLLDLIADRTLIVNRPQALRDANEKLYALRFPELMPASIVTAHAQRLLGFAEEHGGAVLKPIGGHGGRGVMALWPGDNNAPSIIDTLTLRGRVPVMAQRFLEKVSAGDKRILLLDGEPLGAILRVPTERDFRANIGVGGSTVLANLDAADHRIIETLAPALRADGLWFVGLDVVDGHLTEVNVTSPTGICQLRDLSGTTPAVDVVTWLESRAG